MISRRQAVSFNGLLGRNFCGLQCCSGSMSDKKFYCRCQVHIPDQTLQAPFTKYLDNQHPLILQFVKKSLFGTQNFFNISTKTTMESYPKLNKPALYAHNISSCMHYIINLPFTATHSVYSAYCLTAVGRLPPHNRHLVV